MHGRVPSTGLGCPEEEGWLGYLCRRAAPALSVVGAYVVGRAIGKAIGKRIEKGRRR